MKSNGILFPILLTVLLLASRTSSAWHDDWGPWVIATEGEPWPLPVSRELYDEHYCLDPNLFDFQVMQENCDILRNATNRYKKIIQNEARVSNAISKSGNKDSDRSNGNEAIDNELCISYLQIHLKNPCEKYPNVTSDESYTLSLSSRNNATLTARSIWGILRGLETFSQLVVPPKDDSRYPRLRGQRIEDRPRLAHRGLLLDTSRHYLPVSDILKTLDAMSYNKLNVFHWHIVDDNSFPYESKLFPALSGKGAYHRSMVYTAQDIQAIVEYARVRGIRVIPEFDTPGHTKSWGRAYPELLTTCYGEDGKPSGKLGPMNPTSPSLYGFLSQLLGEVSQRFPDKYLHLGGDEVPFDCWKSNPEISRFMKQNNISQRFEKLEELYVQRLVDIAADLKAIPIVWQEVFDNGVEMHEGTVVHVWTGNWQAEMNAITSAGHPVLLSACWYLDHLASGGDWIKYYNCDPLDFRPVSDKQKDLVLGGEACMWGEFVDGNNVHSRIWPRASAAAERLWSFERQDENIAAQRLEEHACRMNRRDIPAQPPNGSGFCVV